MNNKVTNFWRKVYQDPFKRYLVISLAILGVVLLFTGQGTAEPTTNEGLEIDMFYTPSCPKCEDQEFFNQKLRNKYPSIQFVYHDATKPKEFDLLSRMLGYAGVKDKRLCFPITIFGGSAFVGWESAETTGKEMEKALQECLAGNSQETRSKEFKDEPILSITAPAVDKMILDYSLPSLGVILGLVDGFNPCAMWVLVYLISLIMTLRDKRKTWLLVGSFVFASGVLYFLFMTAWLNAFLLIGYCRPVTILIGLVALGAGILNVREFVKTKGAIVCEVGSEESKKKTMTRIEKVVSSPLTLGTIAGIIALAFVVNSIEFVCSSALPAIFTYVLSLNELSTFKYYSYILLYDFFFMLDDLIIFGSAAFFMTSRLGDKYAKYCKPLGGAILLILGVLLLFAPNLLP
jgi:hypothetical protein